jgi:uncharacterized protein (DUF427 family)
MSDDYQVRKDIDRLISTVWETGSDQLLLTTSEEFEEYKEEVSNKYYDTSQITELLDDYALASDVYTKTEISEWQLIDTGISYATLYVNEAIRMCDLRYYRQGYNISSSSSSFTLESSLIPSDYLPPYSVIGKCFNPNHSVAISLDEGMEGDIRYWSTSTGSMNLNFNIIWHYEEKGE